MCYMHGGDGVGATHAWVSQIAYTCTHTCSVYARVTFTHAWMFVYIYVVTRYS